MSKIKVYILDDHQMFLDGVIALFQNHNKYEVVGHNTMAQQALVQIELLKPDLIITDINMPEMDGEQFIKEVRKKNSEVRICVLSMHTNQPIIALVMQHGANGYVPKNTGKQELIEALDKIMEGKSFISSDIAINCIINKEALPLTGTTKLSERELEILKMIASENSNQRIADTLFISERTVETHRKNIFRKTGAKTVVGLVKYAIENQLI